MKIDPMNQGTASVKRDGLNGFNCVRGKCRHHVLLLALLLLLLTFCSVSNNIVIYTVSKKDKKGENRSNQERLSKNYLLCAREQVP